MAVLFIHSAATAQTQPIKGTVIDENGQPVAGAQ